MFLCSLQWYTFTFTLIFQVLEGVKIKLTLILKSPNLTALLRNIIICTRIAWYNHLMYLSRPWKRFHLSHSRVQQLFFPPVMGDNRAGLPKGDSKILHICGSRSVPLSVRFSSSQKGINLSETLEHTSYCLWLPRSESRNLLPLFNAFQSARGSADITFTSHTASIHGPYLNGDQFNGSILSCPNLSLRAETGNCAKFSAA